MADVSKLLETGAQSFETAQAKGFSDTLPVPISATLDVNQTPSEFVPFLAAHESVDLWFSDWSQARKRKMVSEALELAGQKGTLPGLRRFLEFVDATIIYRVAHPIRFVAGRSSAPKVPLSHKPFVGHYLIKTALPEPVNPFRLGRSAIGRSALTKVSHEPIRRAHLAGVVSKNPATLYTFNHAYRRRHRFGDAVPLNGSQTIGHFVDREIL